MYYYINLKKIYTKTVFIEEEKEVYFALSLKDNVFDMKIVYKEYKKPGDNDSIYKELKYIKISYNKKSTILNTLDEISERMKEDLGFSINLRIERIIRQKLFDFLHNENIIQLEKSV